MRLLEEVRRAISEDRFEGYVSAGSSATHSAA
jgi:hypothetical protein